MTPDQVALQTLKVMEIQTWITGLAILLGPLAGVLFTLWFQGRKEKRDAKERLFLVLMSERKNHLISKDVTKALNQMDVVFADKPHIKALWHKYYSLLSLPPGEDRKHTWLEMLASISQELGYKGLSQVDLDKFYIPQGHVDDAEYQKKMAGLWQRVLENTERFVVLPRTDKEA
ncbi:MAG: hypothetical protein Q7T07_20600 [Burkholderiaceae bacterium]|nr:hypothetical protein [Burkholderiaceae bacterium]